MVPFFQQCHTKHIAQCSMSRATLKATGCHHQATTHSVLPQQPQGQQQTKQRQKYVPKRLAILMAAAVHRYNTAHITRWRRFWALLEATKCCHQVSIAANRCNWSRMCRFLCIFSSSTCIKRSRVELKTLVFDKGITYQTKENGLTKVSI